MFAPNVSWCPILLLRLSKHDVIRVGSKPQMFKFDTAEMSDSQLQTRPELTQVDHAENFNTEIHMFRPGISLDDARFSDLHVVLLFIRKV